MGKFFLLISILCLGQLVQAGGASTGGGKGVLCHSSSVSTLEMLELYEAKNIFHLDAEPSKGDLDSELLLGFERLDQTWADPGKSLTKDQIKRYVTTAVNDEFYSKLTYIPTDTRLPLTMDASLPVLPKNCEIAQIAIYNSLGIQMDKSLWDSLDSRNKAALILHEAIYYYRRTYGATTSDETRKFVGQIFSTTPPTPRYTGISKTGYFICSAGSGVTPISNFIAYPSTQKGESGYVLSFSQLDGATTLGRTTTFIYGSFVPDVMASNSIGQGGASEQIESETDLGRNRQINITRNSVDSGFMLQIFDGETNQSGAAVHGSCTLK